MKFSPLFLLVVAFVFAGCNSMPERLNPRLDAVPPQVHDYAGTQEQVYVAVKKAFSRLDFNVTHAVMGRVEAASSIHTSTAFADSRQLVARVAIHEVGPGQCEVELSLTQDVSSQSLGGTHSTALREHGFFATYFAELQEVLQEKSDPLSPQKN